MSTSQSLAWAKSRFCDASSCVEVAILESEVAVRNSTSPDVIVRFSKPEWTAFIAAAQAGDFQVTEGL
jgi:hypothetical protein